MKLIEKINTASYIFWKFFPFWLFMVFFKFAGSLHYSLTSPFGEKFLPLWIVGLMSGGASIVQLLLDVPAGHIMDRFGYLRFLKITTAIFIMATVCFMFGLTETTYIASIVISTFGWLFFGPGINAYALSHSTAKNSGRFMSLKDISGSIGVVLGSVALPFFLMFRPELVGYLLFILFTVSFVALFFSPRDTQVATAEEKIPAQHFYIRRHIFTKTLKAMRKLNPASGMMVLAGLSGAIFYGAVWFVIPLVIVSETSSGVLGIGLGVFDLSVIVLGFILGNLADRANKRKLVFFGLLIFGVAATLTGFNLSWLFIIFGFMATTGDEMTELSLWSWLHTLDKDHANDGVVSGAINLFSDMGWAIGPIVSGFLYSLIGPTWTIVICALPILAVWIAYQFVIRKHPAHALEGFIVPPKPHRSRHRT